MIVVSSILLCACNTNYIKIISDDGSKEETYKSSEVNESQINIDELLAHKEIIKITNLKSISKIAILLPMTGKYSKVGKAIYEGLEIEIQALKKQNQPVLSIYDTGDEDLNIQEISSEILSESFDFLIGPLQKKIIQKVTSSSLNALPILTLNYSNNTNHRSNQVYQFGLLPEDEAICIAEKSIIDGNSNSSIFYPNNEWGRRISKAYALRFLELGGNITDEVTYENNDKKINILIRNILKIEESIKRKDKIENILNRKLYYKPYIPDTVNSIFAVGTSENMRSIKPQFNFNFAEDIAFYSTSHIYNGVSDKVSNQDLNNIKFCDIPWLYNNKNKVEKVAFRDNNEKKYLLRFIALGMDSIKIIYNINKLENHRNKYLLGDTGYLQLNEFNKIRSEWNKSKTKISKNEKFLEQFKSVTPEYPAKIANEVYNVMKPEIEKAEKETGTLTEGQLVGITIDFSEIRRKQKHLDESFLVMFGGWVKWLLGKMFGGGSIPGNIKGSKSEVESFARAMGSEKRYIETAKRYGLDHPTTYKSKAKLSSATKGFEKETGIKWPFE